MVRYFSLEQKDGKYTIIPEFPAKKIIVHCGNKSDLSWEENELHIFIDGNMDSIMFEGGLQTLQAIKKTLEVK